MITKYQIINTGKRNDTFIPLENKLEELIKSYKFIGYNRYLKWSIMTYAFTESIKAEDFDGNNIEKYAEYYLDNVWGSKV